MEKRRKLDPNLEIQKYLRESFETLLSQGNLLPDQVEVLGRLRDPKDSTTFMIYPGRQFETGQLDSSKGKGTHDGLQVTFHEWQSNKHPYFESVRSYFIFCCYGSPPVDAHLLWEILDECLHDVRQGNLFGDLYIYSSLRARSPVLYMQMSAILGVPAEFTASYRIMYSEYDS